MKTRAALIVVMLVGMAALSAPAQSATYRFWSYWTGGETWTYSNRGPAFRVPPDQGVEGWHFAVSPDSGSSARPPTGASSYPQICPGASPATAGKKRVAVVLDFGSAGEAPLGESPPAPQVHCLEVDESATGLQVLQAVAPIRFHSSGLICGLDGYPKSECPTARTQATPSPSPSPTPTRPRGEVPAPAAPPVDAPDEALGVAPDEPADDSESPPGRRPSPSAYASAQPLDTDGGPPPAESPTAPPPWLTAIGVAMVAGLAGLAVVIGRQRQ